MTTSITIGFVLFPRLTQLDFTGPLQVLANLPGATTYLVAKSRDPVATEPVLTVTPTTTFADCPQLDVICVPGGFGVDEAMADAELVGFVRDQAAGARYVTSVCTGTFILGAAGLIAGKRATTHWAFHDLLARFGAIPTKARVVRDGNLFTGGGVTAGIDFGLTLAAEIAGDEAAQAIQLGVEYDPMPPFDSGAPERAPEAAMSIVEQRFARRIPEFAAALDRVAAGVQPAAAVSS